MIAFSCPFLWYGVYVLGLLLLSVFSVGIDSVGWIVGLDSLSIVLISIFSELVSTCVKLVVLFSMLISSSTGITISSSNPSCNDFGISSSSIISGLVCFGAEALTGSAVTILRLRLRFDSSLIGSMTVFVFFF